MSNSLNTWNEYPDPQTWGYHLKQYDEPYRSTVHFADFIDARMESSASVVDAGCGCGAPTYYLAEKYPNTHFTGLDISRELLAGSRISKNLAFEKDDLTNLKVRFGVDGVTLIQVLSWLPHYETALHQIATRLRPKWIAASSLIYHGDIDCNIVVTEHQRPRQSYYNIYGLPGVRRFMQEEGYTLQEFKPFIIDRDLEGPKNPNLMGTYTSENRMQYSGPLALPWGFVMFERQ